MQSLRSVGVFSMLVALSLTAFPASANKVAARVGKSAISNAELQTRVLQLLRRTTFHRRLTPALRKKLEKIALGQLIDEELLFSEAWRLKLVPNDAAIKRARQAQIRRAKSKEKFALHLRRIKMSWEGHWKALRRRMAAEAVIKAVIVKPARVDDKGLKSYYDGNKLRFKRPPMVKLQQILWPVKPGAAPAVWQKAAAAAAKVSKRLVAGTEFRKVAVKLAHTSKGTVQIKEHGWVHQGRLVKSVDTAAFKLKKAEVSKPLKTLRGYVVLRCADRRAAKQMTYSEVKDKLRVDLMKKNAKERRGKLMASIRGRVKVVVAP